MVPYYRISSLVCSFVLVFAAVAEPIELETTHLVKTVEGLANLVEDPEKLNSCFRVESDSLKMYLKNCADLSTNEVPAQSWSLSAPVPSAISDYIAPVEAQYGGDPTLTEEFNKMKSYIPHDSVGRLIFMNFKQKPVVVGYLNTNLTYNETPYKKPFVAELCSGPWSTICTFSSSQKQFVWEYRHSVFNEESYDTQYMSYEILDFLHSSVHSRGNDDFQPLTYSWIKSPDSSAKFPITRDWADALRPLDTDSRISKESYRSSIPRSEANYMTALHPVNVVLVKTPQGRQTMLHFGAKVYYPRQAMESSCEDDNSIYGLVDLKNVATELPLNPEAISHLDLSEVKKEGRLSAVYASYTDVFPFEESKSTLFFAEITGSVVVPSQREKWQLAVMSLQKFDTFSGVRPNNPVREFLYLDKNPDGTWRTELYAFNPNDWEANNSIHPERQLIHSPSSIRLVWDRKDSSKVQSTHPILRAPMKTLQKIPYAKATEEERKIAKHLRTQFSDERFAGIQLNTTHGSWGLEDKYFTLLNTFVIDPSGGDVVLDKIPLFSARTRYVNDEAQLEIVETEKHMLDLYQKPELRDLSLQLRDVKLRVLQAKNPVEQITEEMRHYERISDQYYAIRDFFSNQRRMPEDVAKINEVLTVIWREIPKADRKDTYPFRVYEEEEVRIEQRPLPEELKKAIFNESPLSAAERLRKIEAWRKEVNDESLDLNRRKESAEKMYKFIQEESQKLREWPWLLEDYSADHPRG